MKSLGIMRLLFSAMVLIIFIGCGDGSSLPTGSTTNDVTGVNAGEDKTIKLGETIILEAKTTMNGSYMWVEGESMVDGQTIISFNSKYTFTAKEAGVFPFSVQVKNSDGFARDTVVITVVKEESNENQPPVANAGEDKSVTVNQTVRLTGKGTDSDGTIIDYAWSKDDTVLATTASFDYTPSVVGTDTLKLTVTDNDGNVAFDTVDITVNKIIEGNQPPVANAGDDKSVTVNQSITLTGSGTDSDGSITSYEWKKDNTVLATTASFDYTPKTVGTDTLTLTVTDDEGSQTSDSVVITVNEGMSTEKPLILTIKAPFYKTSAVKLTIPSNEDLQFNYTVDWGDGEVTRGITGNAEHYYDSDFYDEKKRVYTLKISGDFPAFDFIVTPPDTFLTNGSEDNKILSIEQWGSIKWKNMSGAFKNCSDLKINATDIPDFSDVNDTSFMFYGASKKCFPSSMPQWDMSNVKNMEYMFYSQYKSDFTSLNQDISSWNVSSVENMKRMFQNSYYNGDFSKWDVSKVKNMEKMFDNGNLSTKNYDKLLNAWSKLDLEKNVSFGLVEVKTTNFGTDVIIGTQYSGKARVARKLLQSKFKWKIKDSGIDVFDLGEFKPFIIKCKVESNYFGNNYINIPNEYGYFYQYNIDWGDGLTDTNITTHQGHTYTNEGNYTIKISGNFPYIKTDYSLLDIIQWGDNEWKSMEDTFSQSPTMISATDAPNLLAVTHMSFMFSNNYTFNSPISHWDVSNVEYMGGIFSKAKSFNQDLSAWNFSNVRTLGIADSNISTENYSKLILSLSKQNTKDNGRVDAGTIKYNKEAQGARLELINNHGWDFDDGGLAE